MLVVSRDAFPSIHSSEMEMWPQYHDIFVRHAFGNFRDILREVAYSPMQGKYLTFQRSIGFASAAKYPDENFAREFMQLFSIGVTELNPDGTLDGGECRLRVELHDTERCIDLYTSGGVGRADAERA